MSAELETLLNNSFQKFIAMNDMVDVGMQGLFMAGAREGYKLRVPQIEELLVRIKQLEALVYVPGLFRCAKCKFQLNRIEIHAQSGNMRADNTPDSCPNCTRPLWRVTERDAGNDLCDRLEAMQLKLNELTEAKKRVYESFELDIVPLFDVSGTKELLEEASRLGITITTEFENMNDKTRITHAMLDELIDEEHYFTAADAIGAVGNVSGNAETLSLHTFCVLVMKSGTTITGESCCATPGNFDAERGRAVAKSRAMTKAFELEGYKLASERKSKTDAETAGTTGQ